MNFGIENKKWGGVNAGRERPRMEMGSPQKKGMRRGKDKDLSQDPLPEDFYKNFCCR